MSSYHEIASGLASLVEEKNKAYGSSFEKAGSIIRILYPEGIPPEKLDDALTIVRVIDKLFRIATKKDAFGENPWKDVMGYALLSVKRGEADAEATGTPTGSTPGTRGALICKKCGRAPWKRGLNSEGMCYWCFSGVPYEEHEHLWDPVRNTPGGRPAYFQCAVCDEIRSHVEEEKCAHKWRKRREPHPDGDVHFYQCEPCGLTRPPWCVLCRTSEHLRTSDGVCPECSTDSHLRFKERLTHMRAEPACDEGAP
jgi:hypothetical protein